MTLDFSATKDSWYSLSSLSSDFVSGTSIILSSSILYESCNMCCNDLIGETVFSLYRGFIKEQTRLDKSCAICPLDEFQFH